MKQGVSLDLPILFKKVSKLQDLPELMEVLTITEPSLDTTGGNEQAGPAAPPGDRTVTRDNVSSETNSAESQSSRGRNGSGRWRDSGRNATVTGRIIGSGDKTRYVIDGKEVTKEVFNMAFPDKPLDFSRGASSVTLWNKPVVSNALACHPDQIPEIMERNRKAGVNIDYNSEGQPILRSSRDKLNLMRVENCHDRDGAYSSGGPRS